MHAHASVTLVDMKAQTSVPISAINEFSYFTGENPNMLVETKLISSGEPREPCKHSQL